LRLSFLRVMEKRTPDPPLNQTIMYCNNCGEKGHLFRTCRDPVLSCGVFLVDSATLPVDPAQVRVLMIRRKDSMSFAEFMRGKYDVNDQSYVSTLIKNMTLKEQAGIACDSFETLWRQLWGDDRTSSDFNPSREKFNQLNRVALMRENLSEYTEPEWGFPKGRRMRGETDMACAVREFGEETNIPRDAYTVLKNIMFEETFVGLNNVRYRHVYFVALLTQPDLVNLSQRFTPMQRREISGIAWKTLEEADALVRPHHVERLGMLTRLREMLQTFTCD
jgi:8-oxo-dGTP pyrophosphatase MutT (NUDIX family)